MPLAGETATKKEVERRALPAVSLPPTPIRYMGTKRSLGPIVRDELLSLAPGRVADLFCGMGSVAAGMASRRSILANDTARFTSCFAEARFLDYDKPARSEVLRDLTAPFMDSQRLLRRRFGRRLNAEQEALGGTGADLRRVMDSTPHVGSSSSVRRSAAAARLLKNPDDYRLATLYFSSSYFSVAQAIEIDSLRYAIDEIAPTGGVRNWLLSAWLSASGFLVNAPGHTAQFLKPTTNSAAARIKRQWRRSIWGTFTERLETVVPLGNRRWRKGNIVTCRDALDLVGSDLMDEVEAVYADPPYTVDHYSRFYHVYETLYLYDFPDSFGKGRYRAGRFFTPFSQVGEVSSAFHQLVSKVADRAKPMVMSYPSEGVLQKAGVELRTLLNETYPHVREIEIELKHSTLGASSGAHSKKALEKVYVCKP